MGFKPFSTWGEALGQEATTEEPEGFFNKDEALEEAAKTDETRWPVENPSDSSTVPTEDVVTGTIAAPAEAIAVATNPVPLIEAADVEAEPVPEDVPAEEDNTVEEELDTEEVPVQSDSVNHPQHYTCSRPEFETIEVIDAYGMDFSLGNAYKYIIRAKTKGFLIEDLKKAAWYLQRVMTAKRVFTPEVTAQAALCNLKVPTVEDISDAFHLDYQQSKAVDNIFEYAMTGNISAIATANNAILKEIDRLSAE